MNRSGFWKSKYLLSCCHVFLLFFLNTPLTAQEIASEKQIEENSQISQFLNSLSYTTTHAFDPSTFEPWKTVAGGVFLVACFTGLDFELKEEYVSEKHYPPWNIPKYLSSIGKIYDTPNPFYFSAFSIGSIYAGGWYFENTKLKQTAKLMLHSVMITGIYSTFLKAIIGRARPYVGRNPYNFHPFNFRFNADYTSMPSGHTSSIFALMTVLAGQYESYFIKIPAYTFALAVAFQRVDNNKHWVSDVFLGAALGYLVGSSIVENEKKHSLHAIKPFINEKGIGLKINF